MYWLITFTNGKQKVVKANNAIILDEKVNLAEVITIIKLSNDIFENLSEIT